MAGGTKTVPENTPLTMQGKPGVALLVLKRGAYDIYANSAAEGQVISAAEAREKGRHIERVEHQGTDVYVAAAGLFLGTQCASYITAAESELQIIPITAAKLEPFILKQPVLGVNIAKSLAGRLRELNKRVSGAVGKVSKFKQDMEQYCVDFYEIMEGLHKSSQDENIDEVFKMCKVMETYKRGRRITEQRKEAEEAFNSAVSDSGLAKKRSVKRDEVLCNEGDSGKEMWILARGELWVHVGGVKVGEISAGEIVGEMLVLLDDLNKRTAKLVASQNCELGIIEAEKFHQLVKVQPRIAVQLCRMLATRYQNTLAALTAAASGTADELRTLLEKDSVISEDYEKAHAGLDRLDDEIIDLVARESTGLATRKDGVEKAFNELTSSLSAS